MSTIQARANQDTVLDVLERERARMARDIHDGPAQSLAHAAMRLDIVKKLLESERLDDARHEVDRLQAMLRASVGEVRRLIFDLRPAFLDNGLERAIRTYAERFHQSYDLDVTFQGKWTDVSFCYAQEIALFRVFQECLNNVYKHAQASQIVITLYEYCDGWNGFRVCDNGIGFDISETPSQSFGLQGMKERMEWVKGMILIKSERGQGTQVDCRIPV